MKFSVIGDSNCAIGLLLELAGSTQHALVCGAISGPLAVAVAERQLPMRLVAAAEDAFLDGSVETVIVALEDPEEILRLSRSASQSEKHVIVVPPVNCSPALSFELHLILDESRHAIIPLIGRFFLSDLHVDQHVLSLERDGILQLTSELTVEALDLESRPRQILKGLDVLAASGFDYAQVTALESLAPDGSLLSLLITLNSQSSADKQEPPATLVLRPSSLSKSTEGALCVLSRDAVSQQFPTPLHTPVLSRIEFLCRNPQRCAAWMESFSTTLELAEAVKKSLKRRRTVDVHFDTGSERGVFKSQMTAMGCGVLTFMMFGMVAYLVIAQLTSLPGWVLHTARILWIAPLIIFLLAQFLLLVARDRSAGK